MENKLIAVQKKKYPFIILKILPKANTVVHVQSSNYNCFPNIYQCCIYIQGGGRFNTPPPIFARVGSSKMGLTVAMRVCIATRPITSGPELTKVQDEGTTGLTPPSLHSQLKFSLLDFFVSCTRCFKNMRLGFYLLTQATKKQLAANLFLMKIHIHQLNLNTELSERFKEAEILIPIFQFQNGKY